MYQPTSWEYIQFIDLANTGSVAFLADEGANILDAWINTGMAAPHVMATAQWQVSDSDGDGINDADDNCPGDPNPLQEDNDGDAAGDVCDPDDDNDGLSDDDEMNFDGDPAYNAATDTDPLDPDSDGDGLSDFDELNYDGDPAFNAATDTNPLSSNTDGDAYPDGADPVPLDFNFDDGDLAPSGAGDGVTNGADLMICLRIALDPEQPSTEALAHGDLYPSGAPDGEIRLPDCIQLQKLVFGP